jgi:hypothetical protein
MRKLRSESGTVATVEDTSEFVLSDSQSVSQSQSISQSVNESVSQSKVSQFFCNNQSENC